MISLKRYIDAEHTSATLLKALGEAYQNTLNAIGESASRACPSLDSDLEQPLTALGREMVANENPEAIATTATRVAGRIDEWAEAAEADLKRKTADVKELLVTLAQTAASVAATDAERVMRFDSLTARLEKIATLDDVRELRSAVLSSAKELRAAVEDGSTSSRAALKNMQSQLGAYEEKLQAAEKMAAHDPLTGLLNRRKIDGVIERRIQWRKPFSIGLIDLDGFKGINDRLGHRCGDELLVQFSADLKSNARPADVVGRWGGDEFVVVVDGGGDEARQHFKRIQSWVGGSYTLNGPRGKEKVQIELSIGIAEWKPGLTATELIEEADRRMYTAKRARR